MRPKRIAIKFFVTPDPPAPVELHAFIPLFHRFIQESRLPGVLIDVADYAHVPEGPGVLLVGRDVDYGLDLRGGRAGLLTTCKRHDDLPLAEVVRDTLRRALCAVQAIEEDGSTGLRFDANAATLELVDRLAVANDAAGYESLAKELEPVLREVYGDVALERAHGDDPRKGLALVWRASEEASAAELQGRLGGAPRVASEPAVAPAAAPQSPWDISPEKLKELRDSGADFLLIDVRESHEYEVCNLGGRLIPLGTLAGAMGELDKAAHVVVHCKVGGRGAQAATALREAGFENAWNLGGGIFAWIDRIDPNLSKY